MKAFIHVTLLALTALSVGSACAQTAPTVDWSGFHASMFMGGTQGNSNARSVAGRLQYFIDQDAEQFARMDETKLGQANVAGGLAIGWDKQFGRWVLGVQASANSLSFDKEQVRSEFYDSVPGTSFTLRQSTRANWMSALRLRLGWAEQNWLAYVTAGVAHTKLKLNVTLTDNAFDGYSQASTSESVTGPTVGVGGEYALDSTWSIRGDYHYTRFGSINTVSDVTSTNNSGGTMLHKANLAIHGAFVGLSYRFK